MFSSNDNCDAFDREQHAADVTPTTMVINDWYIARY